MQILDLFKVSAVAGALALAGCGGDINLSSDVDNSVGDTTTINEGNGGSTPLPVEEVLPGKPNSNLSSVVSLQMGFDVIVQTLDGEITEDTTLVAKASNGTPIFYAINGPLEITSPANSAAASTQAADGAPTLTIEPGTVLFGQSGNDYIVVHRDGRIHAEGTKSQPIIFTSLQDVRGEQTGAGQWGGLVILGNAPSNKCPSEGECSLQVEGATEGAVFGGTDWEDNSGVLKYVVVKYAGYEIAPDNELNGITFGGVGSGTTVEYIQVHENADDGVEFFGGAVNVKHLVLTSNKDDSVDWDNGFRGKLQHVYIEHAKNAGEANRAIEADNDGSNPGKEPQSNPTIANMTIIGNNFDTSDKDSEGIYLREGTAATIVNALVTGPSEMGECLEFEGGDTSSVTVENATSGKIVMQNSMLACSNGENFKDSKFTQGTSDKADDTVALDLEAWFTAEDSNLISVSPMIGATGIPDGNSPLIGAGQNPANTLDAWFDSADYIGALNGTEDWRQGWAFGFGGGEVTASAAIEGCPVGTTSITSVNGSTTTCQISGRITSDLTLTSNNIYALSGAVFVGGDKVDSATLTIEAGTTIYGREGADYLVISRDSMIEANGTSTNPITFTSVEDLTGGTTGAGQWGGIVLLGNAQSNKCPAEGECSLQVEGVEAGGVFGGTDDTDSSGTLRYVVVKHAGYEIAPDNELNGITFGGVGSGTTVEYIQVHENADDGIEFFGGTVNVKYAVLTANKDDSVDWDNGYRGNMQYILVKHADNDGEANRGIEADNDGSTPDKQPQSNPTIANLTIIGNGFDTADKDSEGIYLREGTRAQLHNVVITGPAGMGECLELEGGSTTSVTVDQAIAGDTVITNSVVACENGENFKNSTYTQGTSDKTDDTVALDLQDWFLNGTANTDTSTEAMMSDVVNGIYTVDTTAPYVFSSTVFFDNASHIGAVSQDNDWTAGWAVGLD